MRTDYGKIKALHKKGKSGSGAKKFTRKQQLKLGALQFLDPYSRKGKGNSEETELGQIPIQPDDDDLPPPDDALVTPTSSTSTSAGFSQRKQPSKKPQGSSDLASVLKKVWAADRAREDDVRKSVQDLGKPPDARQAWAAWFTSVCKDVPDERFREFQQETFTVSMPYLMAPTQQQVQHEPMWQQAPMTQVIQPMWQQTPRPQQHWQTSPQIPQQHIQPFPQQSLSYTPTQDVQSYTATSITTGEMGTSSSNLRSKSAPPTSNILHQAFDATLGPAAGSLIPVLTSQSPQSSLWRLLSHKLRSNPQLPALRLALHRNCRIRTLCSNLVCIMCAFGLLCASGNVYTITYNVLPIWGHCTEDFIYLC